MDEIKFEVTDNDRKSWSDLTLDELRVVSSTLRKAANSPGFAWWVGVMKSQQQARIASLMYPIKVEETLEQEFRKGETQGLEFGIRLWDLLIEEVDKAVKEKDVDPEKSEGREPGKDEHN